MKNVIFALVAMVFVGVVFSCSSSTTGEGEVAISDVTISTDYNDYNFTPSEGPFLTSYVIKNIGSEKLTQIALDFRQPEPFALDFRQPEPLFELDDPACFVDEYGEHCWMLKVDEKDVTSDVKVDDMDYSSSPPKKVFSGFEGKFSFAIGYSRSMESLGLGLNHHLR